LGSAGGSGSGDVPRYREIFVVRMATTISKMKGIAMTLVKRPAIRRIPPAISRLPTKVAVRSGRGIPSLVKRPTPWFV
jgi:hypothetical protein